MANKSSSENYLDQKEYLSPIQFNLINALREVGPLTRRDLVMELPGLN